MCYNILYDVLLVSLYCTYNITSCLNLHQEKVDDKEANNLVKLADGCLGKVMPIKASLGALQMDPRFQHVPPKMKEQFDDLVARRLAIASRT